MADEQTTEQTQETLDGNSLGTEPTPVEESPTITDEKDIDGVFNISKSRYLFDTGLKRPLTAAPTYDPTNFFDQFAHYDDKLYVNIDNNWVVAGSGGARVRAYRATSAQPIPNTTVREIQWNAESFDTGGDFDTSDFTFTLPRDGKYAVDVKVRLQCTATGDQVNLYIKLDASTVAEKISYADVAGSNDFEVHDIIDGSAGSEITVDLYHNCGSTKDLSSGTTTTWMTIQEL